MKRREFITLIGSAAAIWPLVARAQTPKPVIGFMSGRAPEESADLVAAFRQGLTDSGFVDGQNVTMEFPASLQRFARALFCCGAGGGPILGQ